MRKPAKTKIRPARNPVVIKMIERSQKAGPHLDQKRESRRRACRDWHNED